MQFLTFRLGDFLFGIDLARIREIAPFTRPTLVPSAAPCIRGVINLRGQVLPVIDLARKLALPPTELTRRTCLLMVEVADPPGVVVLAVIADSVDDVLEVEREAIAPALGTRALAEVSMGVAEGRVVLLDVDRALSLSELAAAFDEPRA